MHPNNKEHCFFIHGLIVIATIVAHQQSLLHPYAMGHCQPPCFHGLWNIRARLAGNLSLLLTVNFAPAHCSSGKSQKERVLNRASVWSSGTVSGRDFLLFMSLSSSCTQSCADLSLFLLESLSLSSGTAIGVGLAVEPFFPGHFKLDLSLLDKWSNSLNKIQLQEEWYWPQFAHPPQPILN